MPAHEGFAAAEEKMRRAGVSDAAREHFRRMYEQPVHPANLWLKQDPKRHADVDKVYRANIKRLNKSEANVRAKVGAEVLDAAVEDFSEELRAWRADHEQQELQRQDAMAAFVENLHVEGVAELIDPVVQIHPATITQDRGVMQGSEAISRRRFPEVPRGRPRCPDHGSPARQ